VKTKERIADLLKQGVSLAVEVERLKRKIREYIEKVEELEKEINGGDEH
jgi:chaperonin cofactor prefoldin